MDFRASWLYTFIWLKAIFLLEQNIFKHYRYDLYNENKNSRHTTFTGYMSEFRNLEHFQVKKFL